MIYQYVPPTKDAYILTDDKVEQLGDLGLEAKAFGSHFVREGS